VQESSVTHNLHFKLFIDAFSVHSIPGATVTSQLHASQL